MMVRVHLRGVVIGVTILLSIVILFSVFNALGDSPDGEGAFMRHALSTDSAEQEGSQPRPGARSRPAGGPRAARAGGPGARAGGPGARAGGPGARAGGPGARAGGPGARAGGPGARVGGPGARAGGPGARAGGPGARAGGPRAGGPGARTGGPGSRSVGPGARAAGMGGPRGRFAADSVDKEDESNDLEEEEEEEVPAPRSRAAGGPRAAGRLGGPGRARAAVSTEDEEEESTAEGGQSRPRAVTARRKSARTPRGKKSKEEKDDKEEKEEEEEEEEKTTEAPKKKEPPYPEWWKMSYPRSAVSELVDTYVGDQPLFPPCVTFDVGPATTKTKRYGLVQPPNFMRNSKNPCWFEWNGKKDILKCIPYFYIAGVAKSATADLFNRVRGHPTVMAGGSMTYYFWDRLRYGASKNLKYTREAKRADNPVQLKDYAKELVDKHGKNITKELLYMGKSESLFGDASPTYLTENTQWDVFEGNEGCSEPRVIPATFIRHIFPGARIIIILRDPVERLYSRFLANVPYVQEFENATASLFHTFTVQAVQTYRECFAKTSIRHCAYNASLFSNAVVEDVQQRDLSLEDVQQMDLSCFTRLMTEFDFVLIRLSEGMYSVFLEDWFRVFPKEQILILKYEEYIANIKEHIAKVFVHLELDPLMEFNMYKLVDMPAVRKGRTREEEGNMMPETASLLSDFYAPFNMKLADMLNDEKWLYKREEVNVGPIHLEAHEEGTQDLVPGTGHKAEEPTEAQDV